MKRFDNSTIDLGEINKNFTANTFFDDKKSIGTIKIERITSLDITRENKNDNFNTTRSNNSSTTVEFLSIDNRMVFRSTTERYEKKKMVNITGFSDINTEKKNYTEISKNKWIRRNRNSRIILQKVKVVQIFIEKKKRIK